MINENSLYSVHKKHINFVNIDYKIKQYFVYFEGGIQMYIAVAVLKFLGGAIPLVQELLKAFM
ncbi:hypothetical protein [Bacillus cereus]|uniref:hypothetical protein n=1 Tax=Bacillus cereus TaxID=1396 RepID=UPI003A810A3E